MNRLRLYILFIAIAMMTVSFAQKKGLGPVVIVSSYNPEIKRISENIEAFSAQYAERKGKSPVKVENMNCRNLSEQGEWRDRLWGLLESYFEDGKSPAAIVLLGIEASTTYFSLDKPELKSVPVVVGLRSKNIVRLPDNPEQDLATWNPQSQELDVDYKDYNIIGGQVYDYAIERNIELGLKLFPSRDSVSFISDNTLGGVTMRAHFLMTLEAFPNLKFQCIDGREMTFPQVDRAISLLGDRSIVYVGTWRIDKTDTYALTNTTAALEKSNPKVPAFSLSGVGMGMWTVGGCLPDYVVVGSQLADDVADYQLTGKPSALHIINNVYRFDYAKLSDFKIDTDSLPDDYQLVNEPESPFEQYKAQIITVVIIIAFLVIAWIVTFHYLRVYKSLQGKLKRRGEELEIARDKAEEANRMKSTFIANMSHEVRTPLNAIVGFAQLMTNPDYDLTDEEKREYGSYIKINSDTLLNLMNDILDISKIDAERMEFHIVDADMVEVCRTGAESAKTNLFPGVQVLTDLPDHPVPVKTDVLRLQQVFNNLLNNAKKFTKEGNITVGLKVFDNKKLLEVSITDTGCGIPADKAEYVFQRFKQIDSFTQGTGLGLSITRSIIEALGGQIWLDTSYTGGARFVFSLPFESQE